MQKTMNDLSYTSYSTGDLNEIAIDILRKAQKFRVFALYGDMGAGKTTFIKELCKSMGVEDHVTSPTFSLVNEYQDENGRPVYHFDLFRIKNEAEALDFGIETYLYSGNYCFIEWPEKIPGLLPENIASIKLEEENETRKIKLII